MLGLNKVLMKVFENGKQAVDLNAVELASTDYLNGLRLFGIDNTVQRKITPHRLHTDVAGNCHLIFYQQVPHYIPWSEAFVLHRFDVTIEIEMKVGGDVK